MVLSTQVSHRQPIAATQVDAAQQKNKSIHGLSLSPALAYLNRMTRDLINQFCASLPGAVASDPTTELDSWKVGGKMFACFGERINGFSVKTDSVETAQMLIDAGAATKAPYFHKSWVLVAFDTSDDEIHHRLRTSYDIIVKSLPKKVQATLA